MKSSPLGRSASGRPPEIEEFANRVLVHPVSRALVDCLIPTRVSPNQVSVSSMLAALAAGACIVTLPRVIGATAALAFLFLWHVLDGADGDLARRTGRASASGELIDGLCDHASQFMIYVALGIVLWKSLGWLAWGVAIVSALSHTVQANAYETGRKTYRHWVYGANWMRQQPDFSASLAGLANRIYLDASNVFSPAEDAVEAVMKRAEARGGTAMVQAREVYQREQVGLVKRSGLLGATGRSLAVAASLMAGSPLWFFLYEIVALNIALLAFVVWRRRANLYVARVLGGLGAEL